MRAKVPVMEYLGFISGIKKNRLIAFANQRISEGHVLFDRDNMHVLQSLLRTVNEGVPMPEGYELKAGAKIPVFSEVADDKDYDGIDAREMGDVLEGFHKKSAQWYACRCPAHSGVSATSMVINADTGRWYCHMGCSASEIHSALKALVPEEVVHENIEVYEELVAEKTAILEEEKIWAAEQQIIELQEAQDMFYEQDGGE